MQITISQRSSTPIYQQLYDQISAQIIRGDLAQNEPLPPMRTIAKELRVSIITIKKSCDMLERNGLLYTVVGRGTFVESLSTEDRREKQSDSLTRRLEQDIAYCRAVGLSLGEILEWVTAIYHREA